MPPPLGVTAELNRMPLAKQTLRLIAIGVACWVLIAGFRTDTMRIRSPRLGRPFVGPGMETFEAVLDARGLVPAKGWDWVLVRDGIDPVLLTATSGTGSIFRRTFQLTMPPVLPNGGYALEANRKGMTVRSNAAVFFVNEWPEKWTVVHANDLPRLGVEDNDARFQFFVEAVRAVNPQALLITGDVLYLGGEERYRRLIEGLASLPFPVIVAPGNHEREDWSSFIRHFPDIVHSVDLGPFRVLSLDSGSERDQFTVTQLAWLEAKLATADDRPLLIQVHHPMYGFDSELRRRDRFLDLIQDKPVAAVLSGHTHFDDFHGPDGERFEGGELPGQPWFITTTTAGIKVWPSPLDDSRVAGYRVLSFEEDRLVGAGPRKTPTAVPTCDPLDFPVALLPQ